jgi:hypothetical protein
MSTPADITSRAPLVEFTDRFVQPPSTFYVSPDDLLTFRFSSHTAPATARILARILTPSGEIFYWRHDLTTETDRIRATLSEPLLEGYLLGLNVELVSALAANRWSWASVQFARGAGGGFGRDFHALAQGYITTDGPLIWPGGHYAPSTDGNGHPHTHVEPAPPAGVDHLVVVPDRARWRFLSASTTLVTSAGVTNRRFGFEAETSSGNIFASAVSVHVQPASQSIRYTVGQGVVEHGPRNSRVLMTWPGGLLLRSEERLVTVTENIQAGDQYGPLAVKVEEWADPA